MIISNIQNAIEQTFMNPRMEKAFRFLQDGNLENLPEGRIGIDGNLIYAMVQSYQTKLFGACLELEGHNKYIDIQCVVTGHELIGWIHADKVPVTTPYADKNDAWLGNLLVAELNLFRLSTGQVAIFYPTDAHAPQLADGMPTLVKKIVIKVAV